MNEENDFIVLDEEDFVDTPATEETESTLTPEATQTSEAKAEENNEQKILDYINGKGIKYNGESVKVEKLDDLISTYQKGLNYDKLKAKTDETENSVMEYIQGKAKGMGITVKEYIDKVKAYEEQQKKAQVESDVQNMIERGVDEATARSVAETRAYMEELKAERAKFEQEKAEAKAQKDKDQEFEEFLKEYPDVKTEDIPQEVFIKSRDVGLKYAYAQYENKLLKEKIKLIEQNAQNASSSLVTATSNGSPTEQESKDAFLEGFDSED